jgi:branched-chain amino acid aminotransferase
MHRFLLHNAAIRPTTEPCLSPGQVGFMNGWGVFSTLRVASGVLFAFERHWARMRRDAARLRVPFPDDPSSLLHGLNQLIAANAASDSTLRVAVIRNQGGPFEAPGLDRPYDVIAFTTSLKDWGSSVRLTVKCDARHGATEFRGAKLTAWAGNLAWNEEAQQRGFDEVILLDEFGRVSECTSANIFARFGTRVLTPPLDSGCLPGITRELLLEIGGSAGLSMAEAHFSLQDLSRADAVFITSSTRDLLPVSAIEGITLAARPKAISDLQQIFRAYREDYVAQKSSQRAV